MLKRECATHFSGRAAGYHTHAPSLGATSQASLGRSIGSSPFGVGVGGDTSTGGVEMVSTLPAASKGGR